jgi:large subunit ribosomal protein L10
MDQVRELREKLEKCSIAVTTTYTNISVNEMTELRRQVRAAGLDFLVVKNTLMSRAADAAQLPQIKEVMQGPTAVAFGYDEPVDVARILQDYIRTTRSALTIQGAVMGSGPILNTREVERLATLPTRPQLIAQLLNGPLSNFGYLLQARIRQLEAEGPAPVAEPGPSAPEGSTLEGSTLEGSAPEASVPEASAPEASAPEAATEEAQAGPVETVEPAGDDDEHSGDPE